MLARAIARTTIVCLTIAHAAAAQPPVRTSEVAAADPTRSVTLSLAEYNRLIDLANQQRNEPSRAPQGAVVSSADLRVRIERDTARGLFTLAGDVLQPGVVRVPLVAGATLIDGTSPGRSLPLAAEGALQSALLSGPGPFALTLEWGAPLAFAPGRASFSLPVPIAGTARATIDVPGDQADVHVSAGLITRRAAANGRTLVDVTLRPGLQTEIWWSMRDSAPAAAARDVRLLADVLTLVTLDEADARMAALIDVSVVQGEPRSIDVRLPAGYDVVAVSGSSLESSEQHDDLLTLKLADAAPRRHQFLVSLERPHASGSFAMETGFASVPAAQRERGDVAIEGIGTLDLNARPQSATTQGTDATGANLHRIDVRELDPALRSLARTPILSAFRYQRTAAAPARLAMDVTRFADAGVLAAVADRAVATTLVTTEGRALTEIVLHVQNRAQPFVKVALPADATILSVEVAGEAAKPAVGTDGTRVPLLRPGFRPSGTYQVSFVYLHAGAPFLRKGDVKMTLPRMDLPIGIVEWEVFVPEQYTIRGIGGNTIDRLAFPTAAIYSGGGGGTGAAAGIGPGSGGGIGPGGGSAGGRFGGVEGGRVGGVAGGIVGGLAEAPPPPPPPSPTPSAREAQKSADQPSQNVINLQQRAAGVLPVRVDVPRAGVSRQFVKTLVVDQETIVNLTYRRR